MPHYPFIKKSSFFSTNLFVNFTFTALPSAVLNVFVSKHVLVLCIFYSSQNWVLCESFDRSDKLVVHALVSMNAFISYTVSHIAFLKSIKIGFVNG